MALQSSGAISISQIKAELGSSSNSLRELSAAAGKSTPDAMSEFYGYSSVAWPSGRVAYYDAGNSSSYPGSGTSWYDLINNNTMTLSNPSFSSGAFTSNSSTDFTIPGNSTIYSSDFTWCLRIKYLASQSEWTGLMWSESGIKNFLIGVWPTNTSVFCPRIDSASVSMQYWNSGAGTGNGGTSPAQSNGNLQATDPWPLITIVKSGSTFRWYLNDGSTLLWEVSIPSWSIGNTSQAIHLMCRQQGSYWANARISSLVMFNRALSTSEISVVNSKTIKTG